MTSVSGSDPALLAVVLTIRTRSGPRLVYHYPAQPASESRPHRLTRRGSLDSLSSLSSESAEDTTLGPSDSETDTVPPEQSASGSSRKAVTGGPSSGRAESSGGTASGSKPGTGTNKQSQGRKTRTLREEGLEDYEDDYDDEDFVSPRGGIAAALATAAAVGANGAGSNGGPQLGKDDGGPAQVGWDTILDYHSSALSKLLCPGRSAKKKRFEVGVGDLTFLGYPTFVRDDGGWRKKRPPRKSRGQASGTNAEGVVEIRQDANSTKQLGASLGSQAVTVTTGSFVSQAALSEPASEAKSESTGSGGDGSEMSMYNVVFVMNPPTLQHQAKVAAMYENVVKKFAKALKYEQARTGYVWTESQKIMDMKSKGRDEGTHVSILWPQIVAASPLARSIAHIFTAISTSKIAHVSIGETVDASMQIPQTMSTSFASTPGDPQTPGLWVTTASMLEDDGTLSPHAALLLLEDKETLLKEIEGDKRELAAPLSYFIRELTPTKSLQKMAIRLSLRLPDLQFLARHLIYWRRARAIPPLHIRDIYMVSPLADTKTLSEETEAFERRFPGLPGLPQILQSLSSRPLPYGYLIPSQDHKPVYMEILAWLLRGNWVTQLRTFAWVRVSSEIKTKAAIQIKRDEYRGSIKGRSSKRDSETSGRSGHALERLVTNDSEEDSSRGDRPSVADYRSPMLRPSIDASKSDAGSVGSHRTALQTLAGPGPGRSPLIKVNHYDPLSPRSVSGKLIDATDDGSAMIPPLELSAPDPSVILSPHKASTEESRWLSLIRDSLSDEDLRSAWPTLSVYFDGKWALEDVAAREGMKRSRVANLVARLEREGVLCIARHW